MDIDGWLHELGLGQYGPAFRANDIDRDVLRGLSADDLKELGVTSLGHRKKLLEAIASLDTAAPAWAVKPPQLARRDAERRQLTVMFVNLVGSTALSARLDPEVMSEVLRGYQNAVTGEVSRFEGLVAKLMGDGVLAYFGWPRAHEDEPERAVRAGLAIVAAVARLTTDGAALACRVGIATGLVVVGDLVGEGAAQEEAVVGDTPNLAARLQGLAEPGQVVAAEATRRLLGDLFELRALGPQALKGVGGPSLAFAVLAERTLESRFAARRGEGVAALVGRDQELALLVERWRQAKNGEGQLVLLTGEAGIGKSRLGEAVIEAVAGEPHFLIRYQCSPYHADSALHPAIQHLAHAAGLGQAASDEERLDRLETLVALGGQVATSAPLLALLLGLDGTGRYGASTLTPQQRRARTLAALVGQLIGLAARQPVLWVVEDAHWIDPTTLELIELALDAVQGCSALVVVTARPTFTASFASHPVVSRLALNRLARAATQAIVAQITRGKPLPEALLDEIAARTDGVPLFVEEMTKAVLESGALRESAEGWHLDGPLSGLAIPDSLHDSLMARLDRLHPVKEVAQTAAVIGRAFDHATIAALSSLPETELIEAMRRLVEAELVFRRGTPPDATYLFKHALVRDAAYESLLKTKRAALHARLVDVLEGRSDAAAEVKAQHAEAAGLAERALGYWQQAGAQALARPAYQEAIASFENAIRLCHALGEDLRWKRREQNLQLQLGQALIANRGYQATATLQAFERAMALADEIGDVSLQLPAMFGQWAGRHIAASGSAELARRFAALAASQPESGPRLVGLRMLALETFFESRFAESLALTEEALAGYDEKVHRELCHRFGHDPRAAALNYKAWNLWHLGFPDQASRTIELNLRWVRELNHANTTGLALCYGATLVNIWLRRPEQVEAAAREALRLAEEMSLGLWHVWAQTHLGWALAQQDKAIGIEEIEAGLQGARRIGAGRLEPFHLALAAETLARAGRQAEAEARMESAFLALGRGHHAYLAAELHRVRSLPLRGDRDRRGFAEADLRRSLEIARHQESPTLQLRAARDLALLLAERGERQQAIDLLAPIHARFSEGFATPDLIEAKALLGELG